MLEDDVAAALAELKKAAEGRIDGFAERLDDLETKLGRLPGLFGNGGPGRPGAVERKAVNDALRTFCRTGDDAALRELETKSASVSDGPSGGYAAHSYFAPGIVSRLYELSPVRSLARVVPLPSGTSYAEPIETNDMDAVWVGEEQDRPATQSPALGLNESPLHELYAAPKVSQKLLDIVGFDLQGWLQERIANRLARSEGAAFTAGNGVAKPRGFLTYPVSDAADGVRPWGAVQYIPSGHATAITADALIDTQAALKSGYRAGAAWQMNRRTAAAVRKLKDTTGAYLWAPSMQLGQPEMLLGHPVALNDEMPDIAAGSLPIAFGDWRRAYVIPELEGMRLLRDPYSAKPAVIFYCYKRVGGDVSDFEALKLMRIGTT